MMRADALPAWGLMPAAFRGKQGARADWRFSWVPVGPNGGTEGAALKKLSKSTLRWFISTKSLMPIVEIRRRFGINGEEVTTLRDDQGPLYVGLPPSIAQGLEELRQQGKIGYEFAVDFNCRVLLGAYVVHYKKWRGDAAPDEEPETETADSAA